MIKLVPKLALISAMALSLPTWQNISAQVISPTQGKINMEINPAGISSFTVTFQETTRLNRDAEGFIELYNNGKLLRRIPAQNESQLHLFDGYNKYTETGSVQVSFYDNGLTSPATTPGNYIVTIPEGFFLFGDDRTPSQSYEFSWSIEGGTEISPAEGDVESLSTLVITYPQGHTLAADNEPSKKTEYDSDSGETRVSYIYPFEITKMSGTTKTYQPKVTVAGNVIYLTLDEPITESGKYTLTVQSSAIADTFEGTTSYNSELNYTYNVVYKGENKFKITPEEGTYPNFPLKSTGDTRPTYANFTLDLTDDNTVWRVNDAARIYMYKLDEYGNVDSSADELLLNGWRGTTDNKKMYIYPDVLANIDLEPGNYVMVIPNTKIWGIVNNVVTYLPEARYYYTVTGDDSIKYDITPATDEAVTSIKTITLTFDEGVNVTVTENNPHGRQYATISNDNTTYIAEGYVSTSKPNVVTFSVCNTEITEPGHYTFKAPTKGFYVGSSIPVITSDITVVPDENAIKYTLTPNTDNEIDGINEIALTFPDFDEVTIDEFSATLKCGAASRELTASKPADGNANVVIITPNEAVSTYGHWELKVNGGSFLLKKGEETTLSPNVKATYLVEPPVAYTIEPSAEQNVGSLNEFCITFTNYSNVVNSSFVGTLSNGERTIALHTSAAADGDSDNCVRLKSEKKITEAGNWTLDIVRGSFLVGDINDQIASPHIVVNYTVDGSEYITIDRPYIYPEEGTYAEFTGFTLTVNTEDEVFAVNPSTATLCPVRFDNTLGDPIASFICEAGDIAGTIKLTNLSGATSIAPADGNYVLTTPQGVFTLDDNECQEYTYEYTIDAAAGINGLSADSNNSLTVYTTTGICVIRSGNAESLCNLTPGLYIVNGKKLLIRK